MIGLFCGILLRETLMLPSKPLLLKAFVRALPDVSGCSVLFIMRWAQGACFHMVTRFLHS